MGLFVVVLLTCLAHKEQKNITEKAIAANFFFQTE